MRTTAGLLLRQAQAATVTVCLLTFSGCVTGKQSRDFIPRDMRSVKEIIPLTVSNMKGHETLFKEGLYIISSSEKAFRYAKKNSVISSGKAIQLVIDNYKASSGDFFEGSKKNISEIPENTRKVFLKGSAITGKIAGFTHSVAAREIGFGNRQFSKAWESLIAGNISIVKRSEQDRTALKNVPRAYYKNIKNDLRDVSRLSSLLVKDCERCISSSWNGAFERAVSEFNKGYYESGKKRNSLSALGSILAGYGRFLYSGLFSPAGRTGAEIGKKAANAGAIVVAGAVIVTGRTFQSLGLAFFNSGKMGYHLLSPTAKSAVLTALASLSYSLVPVTYVAGVGAGAINQAAFSGGAPLYAAGNGGVLMAGETGKYLGLLVYDGARGSFNVAINQVTTGVVLAYNALTALPAHLFMAVPDTAIFLAWDGPRLVRAAVRGEIRSAGDAPSRKKYTPRDIPVGSVVNLDLLKKRGGVELEVLSGDPGIINSVLEELPDDLRN